MHPEKHNLAIINDIDAAFLDAGVGGPEGRWHDKLTGFGISEAVFRLKVVDGIDARVEVKRCFGYATTAQEAGGMDSTVGRFDATWSKLVYIVREGVRRKGLTFECSGFQEAEHVH